MAMGFSYQSREALFFVRRLAQRAVLIAALAAVAFLPSLGLGAVLYSFEDSSEGWSYTQPDKVGPLISDDRASDGKKALKLEAAFPATTEIAVKLNRANWSEAGEISANIWIPPDAPATAQALLYIKDRDNLWYQFIAKDYLRVGAWNHVRAPISATGRGWEPARSHMRPWNGNTAREILEFGVRVFCNDERYTGTIYVDEIALRQTAAPPTNGGSARKTSDGFIRNLRASAASVACYGKFEVTLELPRDYANPFDPEEVAVDASFISPTGKPISVPGFFYQDYIRENGDGGEKFTPVGRGVWKVRFAPTETGRYYYRIQARDKQTRAETREMSFVAEPPASRGFVRVAKDTGELELYFETSDGKFFFPIGHNIRSPFDNRYATAPWAKLRARRDAGSYAYDRYFERMQAAGENFAEIWMASWWLALEWKSNAPGYHGVGQYNTLHAWKLDRLLEKAGQHGIYLLLVINNHGKFSTFCDQEWASNPFNKANGGLFTSPDEFFSDPRGRKSFENLLRYLVARWGHSQHVFGWKLFSEINLTGSGGGFHRTPAMLNWHRDMAAHLKKIDPWKHPITTHYSGDYKVQDQNMISLRELDFCTVDAYHGSHNPVRIIDLVNETAQFNKRFDKPVIITEFGGSAGGTRAAILKYELHNALWTSVCSPSGATPMLWWWMFIDEEDLYGMFTPIARFMEGEDRRTAGLKLTADTVEVMGNDSHRIAAQPLQGPRSAFIWLYDRDFFNGPLTDESAVKRAELQLRVIGMADGLYRVDFWDTYKGEVIESAKVRLHEGALEFPVPPFHKDIAVKIKPVDDRAKP